MTQVQQPQKQQHQTQVQPAEKGRTIRPQVGLTGRGEKQQVQSEERRRPRGGPAPKGERWQGKPEKKMKSNGHEEGRNQKTRRCLPSGSKKDRKKRERNKPQMHGERFDPIDFYAVKLLSRTQHEEL